MSTPVRTPKMLNELCKYCVAVIAALSIMHGTSWSQNLPESQNPKEYSIKDCSDIVCAREIFNKMIAAIDRKTKKNEELWALYESRGAILKEIVSELGGERLSIKECKVRETLDSDGPFLKEIESERTHYDYCLRALRKYGTPPRLTTETGRNPALARRQILAANAAMARLADAGWQSLEPGCRGLGFSITRSKGPEGAITCERCRELQWVEIAPARPTDDRPACASGLIGLARYPVTGEDMKRCRNSSICEGRDAFAVNDKTPVTYTMWQDVEEYIAWVNEELVLQGFRARLPRTAELIAAVGSSAPQIGGRDRSIRDLHTTESGIAILPATMREWTQDCGERLGDGTCSARKTFAVNKEHRPSVTQSERYPHEATAFRIVVERIIPTPFTAVAATRTQSP